MKKAKKARPSDPHQYAKLIAEAITKTWDDAWSMGHSAGYNDAMRDLEDK